MERDVTIENVGAVRKLRIPIPDAGVVVLQGRNGLGKTAALRAVDSLLAGKGSLEVNDKAVVGRVAGLGCHISLGKRTSRAGELEVSRIEGGDPSVFVDPGIIKPESADLARIKELVRLGKIEILPSEWERIAGGAQDLLAIARPDTIAEKDPVTKASMLKRDFEAQALQYEGHAKNLRTQAAGKADGAGSVNLEAECDREVLDRAVEEAIRNKATLEQRVASARKAEDARRNAEFQLGLEREEYKGPSLEQAQAELTDASTAQAAAVTALQEAEELVRARKRDVEACDAALVSAKKLVETADAHERALRKWDEAIDATLNVDDEPSAEALDAAEQRLVDAKAAQELGVQVRLWRERLREAHAIAHRADQAEQVGVLMRERARACEGVLSTAIARVAPAGIRFEADRLVLDTERGVTFFSELSEGERWRIGLEVATAAGGPGSLIPVRQEAWEALDPHNRAEIASIAKRVGCVILTAEATDGELRATEFVEAAPITDPEFEVKP